MGSRHGMYAKGEEKEKEEGENESIRWREGGEERNMARPKSLAGRQGVW